jgi:hypothetical protein
MRDNTEPTVYVFTAGDPNEGLTLQGVYTDPATATADAHRYANEHPWDEVLVTGYAPDPASGEMLPCEDLVAGRGADGVAA